MKRDIDFLQAYRLTHKEAQKSSFGGIGKKRFLLIGVNLALVGVLAGGMGLYQHSLTKQQQVLAAYVHDSEQAVQYRHIQALQGRYQVIRTYNEMVAQAASTIQLQPMLRQADYDLLRQAMAGGMHMVQFGLEDHVLTATIGTTNRKAVPDYVEDVKRSGTFAAVCYDGWAKELEATTGEYRFDLHCNLLQKEAE